MTIWSRNCRDISKCAISDFQNVACLLLTTLDLQIFLQISPVLHKLALSAIAIMNKCYKSIN